jgi:cytidylate kinase
MAETAPVIAIDGPSGSGKGTVSALVADTLGWHILDSGALYRLAGYALARSRFDFNNPIQAAEIAKNLSVVFDHGKVYLDGDDVTLAIRTEEAGNNASKVAAMPEVRAALLDWQREAARPPGLVADGRDMGTNVFTHAALKVFLTASAEERAQRRYNQLKEKGITSNIADLAADIRERDERDRLRSASPLVPARDAVVIDSTSMTIDEVVARILQAAKERGLLK